MTYLFERFYRNENRTFIKKAILESAKIVSRWSCLCDIGYPGSYHQAFPWGEKIQSLELHESNQKNEASIELTLDELIKSSTEQEFSENLLMLRLFAKERGPEDTFKTIFDYDNSTSDWVVRLSKQRFRELQTELEKRGLPKDLFFHNNDWIIVPDDITPEVRLKGYISSSRSYSPKQWKKMKEEDHPQTRRKCYRNSEFIKLSGKQFS